MLHSYPFYPADWRTSQDVLSLTAEERDIYRNLLDVCWMEGNLPTDEKVLQKLSLSNQKEWKRSKHNVLVLFHEIDGKLHHPKVDERRPELERWHESKRLAGRAGGTKRWQSHSTAIAQLKQSHSTAIAVSKPSSSLVVKPPFPPFENLDASQAVTDMLERRPKKGGRIMAEMKLSEILSDSINPSVVLQSITKHHDAMCQCEQWNRDGGKYCPTLYNYLARGEYLDDLPTESIPPQRVTVPECPLCNQLGHVYLDPSDKDLGMIPCECRMSHT